MTADNLRDFIESISGDRLLAVEESFGDGFVRLKTAEAERRQAKHDIRCVEDIVIEMLRNSRDAHARTIYVASSRSGSEKTLALIDDGDGIPFDMHKRIFEPRVTSKLESMVMDTWGVHGRGMALYSIKSNVLSVEVAASAPGQGAAFIVRIDLDALPERTDQSSLPVLGKDDDGKTVVLSGPHNVMRTIVEFALEQQGTINVFFGSPAEIAATLIARGGQPLSESGMLFSDLDDIPLALRPAAASDSEELVDVCAELGLDISERTAHRILVGEIHPLDPLLETLMRKILVGTAFSAPDIYKDTRGLKLSAEDLDGFKRALEATFADVAEKYYIEATDAPIIRIGKDMITVKFPFEKEL